ncbi:uncharacterized protein [Nicotiana sylvestris]|uniref:uncharacterized protein n=1 Tax=Nicotiana sylvestris TaxID=4096 RepID=UPI00388CE073
MLGHDIEKCWKLRHAIYDLIDANKIEVQTPEAPNINQNPLPVHHEAHMIELVYEGGEPKKPSQIVMTIQAAPKEESTGGEVGVQLGREDIKPVVILGKYPSTATNKSEPAKLVVSGTSSPPAVVVKGVCRGMVTIKPVVQLPLINSKAVPWKYEKAVVMYKGKQVVEDSCEAQGLTRSGRCFAPVELRRSNPAVTKKPVSEEEAEEFLKKMKVQDYSVVEQLKKTPAQISLLSLLIHSDEHHRALMKILNEAHVPNEISINHLETIANKIFELNRVIFSNDDLPVEVTEYNKALYLTIKCEDSAVTQALVDNGSSANICPLSTLNQLKIHHGRIHKNNICVRGFDGNGTATVGDIILELTIGPVQFSMEFQIFDAVSANKIPKGEIIQHPRVASATVMIVSEMLEIDCDDEFEYDEDEAFEEINRELCQFEEKPKPNLNDTEAVNLGDADNVRETKISIHVEPNVREELIKTLM